jgi:hypothetical protein
MLRSLRIVFGTRRGLKGVSTKSLAFFGLISAIVQFYNAIFVPTNSFNHPLGVVIATSVFALIYGIGSTWPRREITRTFKANAHDITLNVKIGDVLTGKGQIVVGFSDTFDTNTSGNKVISATSLQGQLLAKRYNSDPELLDAALSAALKDTPQASKESRSDKRLGKLIRYPVGTVAVLGNSASDRIYALAYSRMNNDLVAESTVHEVWSSLGQLWDAVYTYGQREPVSMPLAPNVTNIVCSQV